MNAKVMYLGYSKSGHGSGMSRSLPLSCELHCAMHYHTVHIKVRKTKSSKRIGGWTAIPQ